MNGFGIDRARIERSVPVAGLLVALLLAGWLLRLRIPDLATALEPARIFFQVALAAFVLSVCRNSIGIRTYGLFGPVVISFTLLEAGLWWGLALFTTVFVLALATSFALAPHRMGTAPRVATVLAVTAIATALLQTLSNAGSLPAFFEFGEVYFPVIVSSWYADRVSDEIDERGWTVPSIKLLWTLFAIVLAYLVIVTDPLVDWFVRTPEAWVALVALNVYVGTRTSWRASEYLRFRTHLADGRLSALLVGARVGVHNLFARLVNRLGGQRSSRELADALGMRRRNRYIKTYNPPHLSPSLDKATVKRRLTALSIPTPATYAIIEDRGDLDRAAELLEARAEFVIKPGEGFGGEGIVVVSGRTETDTGVVYETSKGERTADELLAHVRRILQGQYVGIDPDDVAVVEERLEPAPFFERLCGGGVPDVRVIVFQGFPIMAMTRLPTTASEGAANLHKGAVGVGLAVADGTALAAYQQSDGAYREHHPDTGADLTGFTVPHWETVLDVAIEAAAATGLGYAGVDIVLDEAERPRVLEVNRQPGLGIQNCTLAGLRDRLEFVEALPAGYDLLAPERKLALARAWDEDDWESVPSNAPDDIALDEPIAVQGERANPSPGDRARRPTPSGEADR